MFENEHDQNLNHMHPVHPYMHSASITSMENAAENTSFVYPVEHMPVDGVHMASYWNLAPRPNGYSSPSPNVEVPYYQPDGTGPPQDPYLQMSAAGTFSTVHENYAHDSSSSRCHRQTFHGVESGFVDPTMNNVRGPCKRKSPGIPEVNERGSTSRYYGAGSSSDLSMASDLSQEKPNTDCQQHWEHPTMTPNYRGDSLPFMDEGSSRNVRSRPALDLESNLARTHLMNNPSQHPYSTNHLIDHCSSMDLIGQSSGASNRDWNHFRAPPAAHGRILVSDTGGLSHETNHILVGRNATNAHMEIGGYHDDFNSRRNTAVPQNLHGPSAPHARGVRSSYLQRCTPGFRASSSGLRLGHVGSSDEGLQLVAESYTSRHPRPLTSMGWRNNDRNGRTRISNERYRSISVEAGVRDRVASEGLMIVDRSTLYGSRHMFDQHRDMRLDIDSMSYEELLALEERIGNVNTGLSEDLIPNCLTETLYCSPDNVQEEGRCAICLEEYKNMEEVGNLRSCKHDYHAGCIKKWLSMKNSCPICKGPAMADNSMKERLT